MFTPAAWMLPPSNVTSGVTTPTRSSLSWKSTMRSSHPPVSTVASPSSCTISSPDAAASPAFSVSTTPLCSRSISVIAGNRFSSRQRLRIATLSSVEPSSTTTSS